MANNTLLNYFKRVDNGNKPAVSSITDSPSAATKSLIQSPSVKSENATPSRAKSAAVKREPASSKKKIEDKENQPTTPAFKMTKKEPVKVEDNSDLDDEAPPKKKVAKVNSSFSDDDSDTMSKAKSQKRKRVMLMSDSESETEKTNKVREKKKAKSDDDDEEDASMPSESEEEEEKPKKKTAAKPKNKNLAPAKSLNKSALNSPAAKSKAAAASVEAPIGVDDDSNGPIEGKYKHFAYAFLEEDKIKDIQGRLKNHPEYDPKTLLVPEDFKKKITPAMRQWWEIKSTNFDVVLFFKLGKFYEMYHMDAVVGVKELGLTFMKGDYAHCGFPEVSYSRFADSLVSKGYKVARVEQTETPDQMAERNKGVRGSDKTVRREICRITTPGTKTFNVLDTDATSGAFSSYLFSLVEKTNLVQDKKIKSFGVCFVDTTVGKIHIGQFDDDRNCSKLRTTLAQYPPAHIMYEKSSISKESKLIIDLQNGYKEGLVRDKEMMSASTVLRMLTESDYFREGKSNEFSWPESFKPLLSEHDSLGLTAKSDCELAVNALGGIIWCLKKCLIDSEILTMKNFEIYQPVDNQIELAGRSEPVKKALAKQKYMILDSISLVNLEVFENNYDQTQSGTLFEKIDFCYTQFGKRLLKSWLVNPLCDPDAINDRLDAIDDLRAMEDKLSFIIDHLKGLPDLERLVSKIHQLGNVSKDHPDSRAVMYENDTYSKRKVEDFITILNSFTVVSELMNGVKEFCPQFKSKLLKTIMTIIKEEEAGNKLGFPCLDHLITKFKTSFDANKAKETGKIIPAPGVNEEYDQAIQDIKDLEKEMQVYLKAQSKELGCIINYFGTNKNRYQLEIPENKCGKLSDDYELTSSKKGFKRYWTEETKDFLARMMNAEERREQALRDTMKFIFKKFDNHYKIWNRAVQCVSILDVLLSLTLFMKNSDHEMCRPELVYPDEGQTPFLDIKNGRHPCLTKTFSGDFIPNDLVIGSQEAQNNWQKNPVVLVTGPNMGGKSTLMRQAGLTVILAQIGSYVPAESCRLTPVDRIFTRIGATDKILAGESTFYLELSETASILHHATRHSLVLMDELGRGTATFDGTSIAYSVVKELAQNIQCRSLFSTHYHHLVEEFCDKDNVSMGHMQCMVSDDDQTITFLYKFGEGACPKSHGFNAARLAELPDEIIKLGSIKSVEFENFTKKLQLLKKMLHCQTKKDVSDLMVKFKELKAA